MTKKEEKLYTVNRIKVDQESSNAWTLISVQGLGGV